LISHPYRCIFVHIPKTAGNSINRVFGIGWQDHKDLARYAVEQPAEVFHSYFKFAIVRNPWDRLFSDYNYQRKKSRAKDSKLFLFNERGRQRSFAAWVETALAQADQCSPTQWGGEVSPQIHRWSPQIDWITVDGKPGVDFIARMEHLAEDFPVICRQVGIAPNRLPHRNRRLHWHYSHYYDRHTREVVARYYAQDISAFGYDFEDHTFRFRLFLSNAAPLPTRREPVMVENDAALAAYDPATGESKTSSSSDDYHRPPSRRSRLTAVLAVGVISIGSWLSSGFLSSPDVADVAMADASENSESPPAFTQVLLPLGPKLVPPRAPSPTLSLVSKIQLAAALCPPNTPLPGFASLAEVSIASGHLTPRPARAPGRFGSQSPVFATQRDWSWMKRLRRPQ
jgi:Sulfotransferase family